MITPADCLARVPDDEASIDLRAMLLSGRCRVHGDADAGFVACSDAYPFGVAWGRPAAEVVGRAVDGAHRAGACFALLAREMERRGKRPIWGTFDENTASLALAARLGFEPVARSTSFVRP